MGPPEDSTRRSRGDLQASVDKFVTDGLDPTTVSPDSVRAAIDAGGLVPWERRNRSKFFDPAALRAPPIAGEAVGLRLIVPVGHYRRAGDAAAEIRRILDYPGYGASIRLGSDSTGFSSFVFENSVRGWQPPQVLPWPLKVTGPQEVLETLEQSAAVRRGLAELVPLDQTSDLPSDTLYVFAEMVRFDEPSFHGDALALRFVHGGPALPLPDQLNVDHLREIEPVVFLRPGLATLDDAFTGFVYELSHNEPVDVAAWQSARYLHTRGAESPLVIAPMHFLRTARVSDTLVALQSRLHELGDQIIPISPEDINRLGVPFTPNPLGVRANELANLLDDPGELLSWTHEGDAGEGVIAVKNAVEAVTQRVQTGPNAVPAVQPTGPPPRYTDIQLFDANNSALETQPPLKKGELYTLDVAIRSDRVGLTRERTDQPPVQLPQQSETVNLWVVVSDETDGEEDESGKLFKFDQQMAELPLPAHGNSLGSCQFRFTADFDSYILNRKRSRAVQPCLGIRIYYKLNLIDHVQLNLYFRGAKKSSRPGIEVVFKAVSPGRGVETPNPTAAARELTISITKPAPNSDLYTIAFVAGDGKGTGKPHLHGVKKLTETELNDWVTKFRVLLLNAVFGPSLGNVVLPSTERDDLINNLSKLGTLIVTRLFDYGKPNSDFYKLGKLVRSALAKDALSETAIVQISLSNDTQDFVFPWQILTLEEYNGGAPADPKNLWGYRFIIEVKRPGDGADHRPVAGPPTNGARITYARYGLFPNEAQHHLELERFVNASKGKVRLLQPIVDGLDELRDALKGGGGELLYVYAHGYSAPPNTPSTLAFRTTAFRQIEAIDTKIQTNTSTYLPNQLAEWQEMYNQFLKATAIDADSSLYLTNTELTLTSLLTEIRKYAIRLTSAPIVFLNACESAQVWNAVEESFVSVFLNYGARAVVGTECTIPVGLADKFGQLVLKSIIDGESLGRAVFEGRKELLKTFDNPLGLCYSIYGNADSRLFFA